MSTTHIALQPQSLVEQVSVQAATTPDATAVVEGGERLSYRELDARANELANQLRLLGVAPEVVVGLCLPRSRGMVVACLAILKAGGAYLPLDPQNPPARMAQILQDARASVVIGEGLAESLSLGTLPVVSLSREGTVHGCRAQFNSRDDVKESPASDHNLAYVIYTSGSTGEAKGVEVEHSSLRNLVSWHIDEFDVTSSDRATLMASPGFDAAVWELWPYLAAGASLFIVNGDVRIDPISLRKWLVDEGITITFVPTPMAEQLIAMDWPDHCALRVMLTGADTLQHYPSASLPFVVVNNYGPTECTVVATSGPVDVHSPVSQLPPIGRPIANTQLYVLDENRRPVPAGEAGELFIGGAGVARGYRNRPHLTAERFILDPFSRQPEARLYRTGDIGRVLEDGQISFQGRMDDQVKIRGYRVEPNEVAVVLNRHPMVQASLITALEDSPGNKRLLAYVQAKPNSEPADESLRDFLAGCLPDYMVPSAFVRVAFFPLTDRGKIDREALPAPPARVANAADSVGPLTPLQQRVATMLGSLLRVEGVGVNDNFFVLGGTSLLGAQVIARVRDAFGVELRLLDLFDHPTVAGLSKEIERLLVSKLEALPDAEAEMQAARLTCSDSTRSLQKA
jgi:amino acid adenylation domain-containing protein